MNLCTVFPWHGFPLPFVQFFFYLSSAVASWILILPVSTARRTKHARPEQNFPKYSISIAGNVRQRNRILRRLEASINVRMLVPGYDVTFASPYRLQRKGAGSGTIGEE
ncbi:hypothetical protein V8E53_011063 [Lactarius tabidus]